MKPKCKAFIAAGFVIFFFVVWVHDAYAYLDPGTGSYFLQILIAGLLGALFLIKGFWKNIVGIVKVLFLKLLGFIKRRPRK